MQSHHTISITIPTKAILYGLAGVGVGLAIGAVLIGVVAAGLDLWTPFLGLPALAAASTVPAVTEAPAGADDVLTLDELATPADEWLAALGVQHPAVVAFTRVPRPVRHELDRLVDRVLAEKYAEAA